MPGMETGAPERTERRSGFSGIAQFCACRIFDAGKAAPDFGFELARIGLAVGVVVGADVGGDRETRRHGETKAAHLREIGTFAAE